MSNLNQSQIKTLDSFFKKKFRKLIPKIYQYKIMSQVKLDEFWQLFTDYLQNTPVSTKDFVSYNSAEIKTGLDRRGLKALAEKGILREVDAKIALPDAKFLGDLLGEFPAVAKKELLKETSITGQKKYLMLDFHNQNSGKTIKQHQVELLFKLFSDYFGQFYDITPKRDFKTPLNLTLVAQQLLDHSEYSSETLNELKQGRAELNAAHQMVKDYQASKLIKK